MKKILPFVLFAFCFGCKTEEEAGPANEATFIRYFGSEYSHVALVAEEANDGFTMLSNIEIPFDGFGNFTYKARMIHTDTYGNRIWEAEYPSFEADSAKGGFKASSFITLDNGYLLVGERIKYNDETAHSDIQLIQIDFNGSITDSLRVTPASLEALDVSGTSVHGKAVTKNGTGNYIVLGSVSGIGARDMVIAEISSDLDEVLWSKSYGDGITTVTSRVYSYPTEVLWGGTYRENANAESDFRIVQSPHGQGSEYAEHFGKEDTIETANDFCAVVGGFAFIGSMQTQNSAKDIIVTKASKTGFIYHSETIKFQGAGETEEIGNSLSETKNGSMIALGTVTTTDDRGNGGTDLFLFKLTGSGELDPDWTNGINYGGPNNETGASVRETLDGSYLIYGNVTFGTLKKLVLMKVNSKGEL